MNQWTQKLDEYLAKTKISKKQLALQLGISDSTLTKWWRNREPSPEHAEKLSAFLAENEIAAVVALDRPASANPSVTDKIHDDYGERFGNDSVIVSLLRNTCPFCESVVEQFRSCNSCGQHFVWANVPLQDGNESNRIPVGV